MASVARSTDPAPWPESTARDSWSKQSPQLHATSAVALLASRAVSKTSGQAERPRHSLEVRPRVTPIADRLRMPFAAFAFACVVSMIPGVYLFRMAGGLGQLSTLGSKAPSNVLPDLVGNGTTAAIIVMAISFGLILPKIGIDHFGSVLLGRRLAQGRRRRPSHGSCLGII